MASKSALLGGCSTKESLEARQSHARFFNRLVKIRGEEETETSKRFRNVRVCISTRVGSFCIQ